MTDHPLKRYRILVKPYGLQVTDFYLEATSFSDARRRAKIELRHGVHTKIVDVQEVRQ